MKDKFVLGLNNFTNFNSISDFPLTEELIYYNYKQFLNMKSFFCDSLFHSNFKKYLLYKSENEKFKIINGDIEIFPFTLPFQDLNSLPDVLYLKIIKGVTPQDIWLYKSINKKDLKLFLDTLDITENNIKVILE